MNIHTASGLFYSAWCCVACPSVIILACGFAIASRAGVVLQTHREQIDGLQITCEFETHEVSGDYPT